MQNKGYGLSYQWANIIFCQQLGNLMMGTLQMLPTLYDEQRMSCCKVFEYHWRLKDSCELLEVVPWRWWLAACKNKIMWRWCRRLCTLYHCHMVMSYCHICREVISGGSWLFKDLKMHCILQHLEPRVLMLQQCVDYMRISGEVISIT
jgi:hypothetical protein